MVRTLTSNRVLPPTAVVIVAPVVESPLPTVAFAPAVALSPLPRAALLALAFFPFASLVTIPIAIVLLVIVTVAVVAVLCEGRPAMLVSIRATIPSFLSIALSPTVGWLAAKPGYCRPINIDLLFARTGYHLG